MLPVNAVDRETLPLSPGDTFVLFSDGVSEAMNVDEDFYGEDRLLETLAPLAGAPAADIVTRVLADVKAFASGARQSDDITVLVDRERVAGGAAKRSKVGHRAVRKEEGVPSAG